MDQNRVNNLVKIFKERLNENPTHIVKSCGRLEVIGNHVDYASGFLINGSIENMSIVGVASKRSDDKVYIESIGYPVIEFKTDDIELDKEKDYETSKGLAKGVLKYFEQHGFKKGGFNIIMDSTLPSGVGVSSSAAFSMVVSKTLAMFYNEDQKIDNVFLALASQWAENIYFGKNSGLQDQLGSCSDGMELLDFKDQQKPVITHFIPKLGDYSIVLVKSKTSHANASDAFNSIPSDYGIISKKFNVEYLRFLDKALFMVDYEKGNNKNLREYKRAFHFLNEEERVTRAFKALNSGDIDEFKKCINESGYSNKNFLQNILIPGQLNSNLLEVYEKSVAIIKDGAVRVHGGGFGGACFVIINNKERDSYLNEMIKLVGKENIYPANVSSHALEWIKL